MGSVTAFRVTTSSTCSTSAATLTRAQSVSNTAASLYTTTLGSKEKRISSQAVVIVIGSLILLLMVCIAIITICVMMRSFETKEEGKQKIRCKAQLLTPLNKQNNKEAAKSMKQQTRSFPEQRKRNKRVRTKSDPDHMCPRPGGDLSGSLPRPDEKVLRLRVLSSSYGVSSSASGIECMAVPCGAPDVAYVVFSGGILRTFLLMS